MSSSATLSALVRAAMFIDLLPFAPFWYWPSGLVLALRQAHDQPVERLVHRDLARQPRVGPGQRGKAQHAGFLRARHRRADRVEPGRIDIDMTGRAGAFPAAIGVDAGNVVVDRPAHDRASDRHLYPMLASTMFDIGDLRHNSGYP